MASTAPWPTLAAFTRNLILGFVADANEPHPSLSPMRQRIYDEIRRRPGISVSELRHRCDTTWPNAKYHATRLEATGAVATRVVGRRRVYFARDLRDARIVIARAILAEPTARTLALYVASHPRETISQLAGGSGESPRAVYYHLKHFIEAGIAEHERGARYTGVRLTTLGFNALQ